MEDGLALLQLTGRPTWAVPGAGFMADFEAPAEVREVILAPDNDDAGRTAIAATCQKLAGHGLTIRQLLPPPGMDWCQVLEDYDERIAIQEEPVTTPRSWVEEFCDGL
jgi:hypothetical protein